MFLLLLNRNLTHMCKLKFNRIISNLELSIRVIMMSIQSRLLVAEGRILRLFSTGMFKTFHAICYSFKIRNSTADYAVEL